MLFFDLEPDCDINLVFITQIGLVTIVEHAPAVSDAYTFATNLFSMCNVSLVEHETRGAQLGERYRSSC